MSGVNRFEAHYLTEGVMGGKALACAEMVLASDYDACASRLHEVAEVCAIAEQERDTFKAECVNLNNILDQIRAEHDAELVELLMIAAGSIREICKERDVPLPKSTLNRIDAKLATLSAKP